MEFGGPLDYFSGRTTVHRGARNIDSAQRARTAEGSGSGGSGNVAAAEMRWPMAYTMLANRAFTASSFRAAIRGTDRR